jgi:glycosyltransferase involved in cell wall biosynthesis
VSSYATECGIATYASDLGAALITRGHTVEILAMHLDARAAYRRDERVPYVRCWHREQPFDDEDEPLPNFEHLDERLGNRFDVIHVQHEYGLYLDIGGFSAWLAGLQRRSVVVTCHTVPVPGTEQAASLDWFMAVLNRCGRHTIAHQEAGAAALRAYGIKHAHCIPHGSPMGLEPTERSEARRRLGLHADGIVAATLGFWTPGKRNDDTIRAVVRLLRAKALPEGFTLIIAGQPMGQESVDNIQEWCRKLEHAGLSDRIQIRPGFVDDGRLADYYGAADFVIANSGPTMYSTSGRGHLAMAYGAAVLAADVPLLEEFRGCGLTFASCAGLEAWIARLATDAELRTELRQRASDYAALTSWQRVAAAHEAVYTEAMA